MVEVVEEAAVCAMAMFAVNSIAPKKVRLLRLQIVFFIWKLSYNAVMDGSSCLN